MANKSNIGFGKRGIRLTPALLSLDADKIDRHLKSVDPQGDDQGPNVVVDTGGNGDPFDSLSGSFHVWISVKRLRACQKRVEKYLAHLGFIGTLDPDARTIQVSPNPETKDAAACFAKARHLLHLFAETVVPPDYAIELVEGEREHILIKTGTQEGGLRSKYGITKGDFKMRLIGLYASRKEISELTCCNIYVTAHTVVAVGDSSIKLKIVKLLVMICVVLGFYPKQVIRGIITKGVDGNGFPYRCWSCDFDLFFSKRNKGEFDQKGRLLFLNDDDMLDEETYFEFRIPEKLEQWINSNLDKVGGNLRNEMCGIEWLITKYGQGECSMKVSTTSKDQCQIDKCRLAYDLFATTTVPPSLAVKIMAGKRQCVLIRTGFQQYGLSLTYGIKKEDFAKRQERLMGSIEAIGELTECNLYVSRKAVTALSKKRKKTATATAVGTFYGLEMVRIIVEGCIVHNVVPEEFIKNIEAKGSKEEKTAERNGGGNVTSDALMLFCQEMLQMHGISCESNVGQLGPSMAVSTTRNTNDQDSCARGRHFSELVAATNLPISLVVEIMNGRRKYIFMKIGTQEGRLCSKFGIKEDVYIKRRKRLVVSLQEIIEPIGVDIYVEGGTVTAVGSCFGPPGRLEMVRTLVEGFIVHDVDSRPASWLKPLELHEDPASGKRPPLDAVLELEEHSRLKKPRILDVYVDNGRIC